MKIKYLGTAAAEGIPAVFCECETCKKAMELGGKNIRTRSQAIIDDKLLLDFPADTYIHSLKYGIRLSDIKNCLITHSHSDHLYPKEIYMRKTGVYAHISGDIPITFYADQSGYELIDTVIKDYSVKETDVAVKKVELYKPFMVDGYEVTALRATHAPTSSPVVYLIKKDGKTIFYCHDTSEFCDEAMEYLKNSCVSVDLISLDCTEGAKNTTYSGHLNIFRCDAFIKQLKKIGVISEKTRIVMNHFSHNGGSVLYDDFVKIASEYGFEVSFDGMEIEI